MALVEDVVAAAGVILAAEEVVEPDLVESCGRSVGRNVAADSNALALCTLDLHGGVPTDPPAVATFDFFVTGEPRFVFSADGVDVVGGSQAGNADSLLAGALDEVEHDVACAGGAGLFDQRVKGVDPVLGLLRVDVGDIRGETIEDGALVLVVQSNSSRV